jgi:hypothetical protein
MPWRWRHTPSSTTVLGGPSELVWVDPLAPDGLLQWRCKFCGDPWKNNSVACSCGSRSYYVVDPVEERILGEVWLPPKKIC